MRPLYLAAPPMGILLTLLAIPSMILLIVLGLFSRRAAAVFEELAGKEDRDE